ncbi:MAG: hypothetical protein WBQ44_00470 [Rhodococcus sp. (in: high G+C Gram-positive bacteria)]
MGSEALILGGRSGVGKTTVALEMHAQLTANDVSHCVIDGDFLDMAHPLPWAHKLAEQNLTAMWRNYRALGYRRLIYINSASVLPDVTDELIAAMGDSPTVCAALLTCSGAIATQRLSQREGTATKLGAVPAGWPPSELLIHLSRTALARMALPSSTLARTPRER